MGFIVVIHPEQASAATVEPPPPISGHPRVFVTANDRSALQTKFGTTTGWAKVATDTLISYRDKTLPATFYPSLVQYNSTNQWVTNANEDFRRAIEAFAFMYVIDPSNNGSYGTKAVARAKEYFEYLAFPATGYDEHVIGDHILTLALVYDWCYDKLTADDKTLFIGIIERLASQLSVGYPTFQYSVMTSHGSNAVWKLDLLAAGIAIYDEKPEMYNIVSDVVYNQIAPSRDFLYQSEMPYQGVAYGASTYVMDQMLVWLYKKMGLPSPYKNEAAIKKVAYRFFYERRPDGQLLRGGDNYMPSYTDPGYWWINSMYRTHPAYLYQDSKLLYMEDRDVPFFGTDNPIYALLFRDLTLTKSTESAITSMPLTKYFGSPIGSMIARTGWDTQTGAQIKYDSTDVVAEMKIQEYAFNSHSHYDAGSFQLYYKGALAIKSGIYDGLTDGQFVGYGSAHDFNYQKRSIASNTLLIEDTTEAFQYWGVNYANDGGQRIVNGGNEAKNLEQLQDPSKGYKTGEVLAHGKGGGMDAANQPNFSYLKGNITAAYSSKVSDVKRSFVFLNLKDTDVPAALITYDTITAAKKKTDGNQMEKKWILHSIEEPVIDLANKVTTIKRTEGQYNGKLVNKTLFPASVTISKVGGTNQEFFVDGNNYPIEPNNLPSPEEAGNWRVEISPSSEQTTDQLLNIMQVMDADKNPVTVNSLKAQVGGTDKFYGVQIKDRAVYFSVDGNPNSATATFTIGGTPNTGIQFLIADMKDGYWEVSRVGSTPVKFISTKEGGYLSFTGYPGDYTLTYKGYVDDTQAPSTPGKFRVVDTTPNSITLAWDPSTDNVGVKEYIVYKDGYTPYTTTETSVVVPVTSGLHSFTVYAKDEKGNLSAPGWINDIQGADTEPPSVPGNVHVKSASGKFIYIGWDASTDNVGVTGYDIYEGSKLWGSVGSASNTFIFAPTAGPVTPSTLYHLTVVAKDAAGNTSAARTKLNAGYWNMQSSALDAWTISAKYAISGSQETYFEAEKYMDGKGAWTIQPDTSRSGAMRMIPGSSGTNENTYLKYKIKVPAGAGGTYYVKLLGKGNSESTCDVNYMGVSINGDYHTMCFNTTNDDYRWVTTGSGYTLSANMEYEFTLFRGAPGISIDQIAISKSATPPSGQGGTPATPIDEVNPTRPNLSYAKKNATSFDLAWTPSKDNSGDAGVTYQVMVSTDNGVSFGPVGTASASTTKEVSGLSTAIEYIYKVMAKDAGGYVSYSNQVKIKPY